jgi:acetylornithine/N-succinyldiaminopimelate aminotransferase
MDIIEEDGLLRDVTDLGRQLADGLCSLAARHDAIGEVRGLGLMVGAELGSAAKEVVARLLRRGFIANAAHETVLRLLPPFIIRGEQIDEFLGALDGILGEMEGEVR